MTIALRDYQIECLNSIQNEFQNGINKQLIVLPTGSGKTIVMAAIAKNLNKKTLLLAHREELLRQSIDKFRLYWPNVDIGLCKGDIDEIHSQVVIGSVQSCCKPKRLERLREQGFELLLIDEAHHSVNDSYLSIINALGFGEESNKLLVGVTATPQRNDRLGLASTFEKITFNRSISTMIKAGYLSPVIGRKILTNFSLERIRTQNGDFAIDELSEAVNTPERNTFIVSKFREYAPDRKCIAFCCDVKHCKDLADTFKTSGIASAAVYGDMEPLERKNTLENFKGGQLQIVTSCGILTEGYDEPSVNAVIMARPTKSSGLYTQCIGRGLRLWPGKQDCLVIDFTDRHHTLDGIMSLSSTFPDPIGVLEDENTSEKELQEVDRSPKIECLESIDKEFDILGCARFIWVQIDDEWSLQDDERNEIVMQPQNGGYVATLYFFNGQSHQIVTNPIPLEYCNGVCEDYARRNLKIAFAEASKPWMAGNAQPTQGQINFLEKLGKNRPGLTRGEASTEIRKAVALKNKKRRILSEEPITHKQRYILNANNVDITGMTKLDAMQAIAKIKQIERAM